MAGNIQLPQNLADLVDVELVVKKKPEVLTQFLTDLLNKVSNLEARIEELENDD